MPPASAAWDDAAYRRAAPRRAEVYVAVEPILTSTCLTRSRKRASGAPPTAYVEARSPLSLDVNANVGALFLHWVPVTSPCCATQSAATSSGSSLSTSTRLLRSVSPCVVSFAVTALTASSNSAP